MEDEIQEEKCARAVTQVRRARHSNLRLTYSHPDKITLGPNETMEQVEDKFVELTKAYKSLTDEVIRENLAKYGNPDGPQQREDKIAIPQWIVEGKNSIWVLVAYGLLLGGGIPWIVVRPQSYQDMAAHLDIDCWREGGMEFGHSCGHPTAVCLDSG